MVEPLKTSGRTADCFHADYFRSAESFWFISFFVIELQELVNNLFICGSVDNGIRQRI